MQVLTPQPQATTRRYRRESARALHGSETSYASNRRKPPRRFIGREPAFRHWVCPGSWTTRADGSSDVLPWLGRNCGPIATALLGVGVAEAHLRIDFREQVLA